MKIMTCLRIILDVASYQRAKNIIDQILLERHMNIHKEVDLDENNIDIVDDEHIDGQIKQIK